MAPTPPYDAILLLSFGGPERREDVMPFLENVVRGKNVPKARLLEVAEHYYAFEGRSPINGANRALIAALREDLSQHGIELPIYWGNRNWHPLLADTMAEMRAQGVQRALAIVTSAYGSYSGCRQYLDDIEAARVAMGQDAPVVEKVRAFFNHPLWIDVWVDRVREALAKLPDGRGDAARLAFTAHSLPVSMAEQCAYTEQLEESCRLVAEELGRSDWQLVYQSRSGPPQVPWLGPDIVEHAEALSAIGVEDLVVVPIGFVSDHMEVVFDLDTELTAAAAELGMRVVRAATPGAHPTFVAMLRKLVEERLGKVERRRALGSMGPAPDLCAPGCCPYPGRRRRDTPTSPDVESLSAASETGE